jgi:hypothetical protein
MKGPVTLEPRNKFSYRMDYRYKKFDEDLRGRHFG